MIVNSRVRSGRHRMSAETRRRVREAWFAESEYAEIRLPEREFVGWFAPVVAPERHGPALLFAWLSAA